MPNRPPWQTYLVAIVATGLTLGARLLLAPILNDIAPLLMFIIPVMLSAWFGGFGPGITATLLSVMLGLHFLIQPRGSMFPLSTAETVRTTIFLSEGLMISALNEALHIARRREARGRQELAVSEERFRATFEQAAVGMAHLELDGRWVRVNRRLAEIVQYRPEELLEQTFQSITYPPDLPGDLERLNQLARGEVDSYTLEKRYICRDGSLTWVNITVSLLCDAHGTPHSFISVIEDINQRKAVEAELVQLNATLEQRVLERTEQLEAANRHLEAFTYSISHDLRAPLRAMQGFGVALLEDYGDHFDAIARDYSERIIAAAARMDTLIQDLLAYSRLDQVDLYLQPVALDRVVAEIITGLADEIRQQGASVTVEAPFPSVLAHRSTVTQAITNLLTNALKFMAPDVHSVIRIWAEERGSVVRLWVEDNGIGISEAHQQQIFRVFERLHGAETYPGTGIGLAIVEKAIARMGGQVGVESQPGVGSRFWIELKAG